ncbi:hypothetical protein Hypma_014577 [Hypsizygus marmoreus]|uniref:Uncharacterized protein n=1 Tax=Hypsizygus marmoreus TaxID=39966 RepID=A0A369JAJ5_HYPMA|nr:hypothetical protein Hypma_014577 [Hypsizygus marmoreus]
MLESLFLPIDDLPMLDPPCALIDYADSFTQNLSFAFGKTGDSEPGERRGGLSEPQEEAVCYASTLYATLRPFWPILDPGSIASVFSPGAILFGHDLDQSASSSPLPGFASCPCSLAHKMPARHALGASHHACTWMTVPQFVSATSQQHPHLRLTKSKTSHLRNSHPPSSPSSPQAAKRHASRCFAETAANTSMTARYTPLSINRAQGQQLACFVPLSIEASSSPLSAPVRLMGHEARVFNHVRLSALVVEQWLVRGR